MTIEPEQRLIPADDAYWMIEIRLSNTAHEGKRYLCHAYGRDNAGAQAKRLMGADSDVRGFTYYRIDGGRLDTQTNALPDMGLSRPVLDQGDWTRLMVAHEASTL